MKKSPNLSHIGHYDVIEVLGSGSFSTVYKVMHKNTHVVYACKVMPKSNLTDTNDIERFQREIDSMAFLRHENLVALYDFFQDKDNFFLIMDLCSGGELFDYIIKNDKVSEPTAALIFHQIASAVAYCHSYGVAHRDLKPENILFDHFPYIKVADFGLCGFIQESKMMKTFCGSPCYCAPECLCRVQYDGRLADIWSMGVILYAMVTGEHPWNISNTSIMLRQIISGTYSIPSFVSKDCADLIRKLMCVNSKQRIKMDQILSHPFLKKASKANVVKKMGLVVSAPSLPLLQPVSISDLTTSLRSAHASARGETIDQVKKQVVSPFSEDETDGDDMPNLLVRSASVDHFVSNGIKRKKFNTKPGSNLVQWKQQSCSNLLQKNKPVLKQMQMSAIKEEE